MTKRFFHGLARSPKQILWIVIILGAVLRLVGLGRVPIGYTWDEMGIVYDGWSLATQGTDHLGHSYPLTFESFGDYKAPFLPYLLALVYLMVPFNEIWIRVVSALAGISLIPITYGLAGHFFPARRNLGVAAAVLAVISPVLTHWSRVGFEANIAIALMALGVYGMTVRKIKLVNLVWGGIGLVLAMLTYQSPKIVVPLWLLGYWLIWFNRQHQEKKTKGLMMGLCGMVVLILVVSITTGGNSRASQTLIFWEGNNLIFGIKQLGQLFNNLVSFWSPQFWLFGKQETLRNMVSGFGPVYLVELPFLIYGLYKVARSKDFRLHLLIWWLTISFLPSIISRDSPHMIRMSLIFPSIQLLTAFGMVEVITKVERKSEKLSEIVKITFIGFITVSVFSYINNYFHKYAEVSARDFNFGYKEVLERTRIRRKQADKIVMTNAYGQPYIYVLVYGRIKPKEFLAGALTNFEFRLVKTQEDSQKTLVIATPNEIPVSDSRVVDLINYPNSNQTVFVVARNP